MTQRAILGISAVVPFFLLVGCTPADDIAPATPGTGGGGGVSSGTGGSSGSGGQTGTGGSSGSGGAAPTGSGGSSGAGGNDGGPVEVASDVAAADVPAGEGGIIDPGSMGDGRFAMAAPANSPEAMGRLPGVMTGMMGTVQIPAAGGVAGRTVNVYTPAGYVPGTPIAFMVCHDGTALNGSVALTAVLDNLAFQKKAPPVAVIFIPPVSRSPEYDTVNARFTEFITTSVLPAVATARNLKLTTDPEYTATCGHSSGGILAFTMAWFQPDRYRRVLSLSGSFTNLQNPGGGMYDSLVRTTMPRKPIRTAMTAGTNDLAPPRWTQANETMSMALIAGGYHHRYFLITGGTHNQAMSRTSMPDLLTYLWRGTLPTGPTR